MDDSALGERPNNAKVYQHIPYPTLKTRYSRFRETPSSEVPQWPTEAHPNRDGFLGHLLTWSHLLIHCQNQAEI
jgi:hypothetical protein